MPIPDFRNSIISSFMLWKIGLVIGKYNAEIGGFYLYMRHGLFLAEFLTERVQISGHQFVVVTAFQNREPPSITDFFTVFL